MRFGTRCSHHLYARRSFGVHAMNDPIVDEVRRVRDAHAARFNYDLDAIFQDIKEQERKSGRQFVSTEEGKALAEAKRQAGESAVRQMLFEDKVMQRKFDRFIG